MARSTRDIHRYGIPTLHEALHSHSTAVGLKKLAALLGLKGFKRKAEAADAIETHLRDGGLRELWDRLNDTEKAAVSEVVHSESTRFDAKRFRAKYGREPFVGSLDEYSSVPPTRFRLFFYGDHMPLDLKRRLSKFVPEPEEIGIETVEELPDGYALAPFAAEDGKSAPLSVHESERRARRELLSVLRLAHAGKIAVSDRTGMPSSATVRQVEMVLECGDFYPDEEQKRDDEEMNPGTIRAFAWPMLLQAGKLVRRAGKAVRLSPAGRKALSAPPVETIRMLWEAWQTTTVLDELQRVDAIKGQRRRGSGGPNGLPVQRAAIRETLEECPPGEWIEVDVFERFMEALGNRLRVGHDLWNLYIVDREYGSLGYAGSENVAKMRYLLCFLFEYAATLGLIDVAFTHPFGARHEGIWGEDALPFLSRYDGLIYFRINTLGSYCLGPSETYVAAPVEQKPALQVLGNFDVVAAGERGRGWSRATASRWTPTPRRHPISCGSCDRRSCFRLSRRGTAWRR